MFENNHTSNPQSSSPRRLEESPIVKRKSKCVLNSYTMIKLRGPTLFFGLLFSSQCSPTSRDDVLVYMNVISRPIPRLIIVCTMDLNGQTKKITEMQRNLYTIQKRSSLTREKAKPKCNVNNQMINQKYSNLSCLPVLVQLVKKQVVHPA